GARSLEVDERRGRARARGCLHGRAGTDAGGLESAGQTTNAKRQTKHVKLLTFYIDVSVIAFSVFRFYVLFSSVFLRAAMRMGSGTFRSMAICARSFEFTRCS